MQLVYFVDTLLTSISIQQTYSIYFTVSILFNFGNSIPNTTNG